MRDTIYDFASLTKTTLNYLRVVACVIKIHIFRLLFKLGDLGTHFNMYFNCDSSGNANQQRLHFMMVPEYFHFLLWSSSFSIVFFCCKKWWTSSRNNQLLCFRRQHSNAVYTKDNWMFWSLKHPDVNCALSSWKNKYLC